MSAAAVRSRVQVSASAERPSPLRRGGLASRIRQGLFNNVHNTVLSVVMLVVLGYVGWHTLRWAVLDAVWHADDAAVCKQAAGACWAIVGEKYRLILFGTFPYEEQWRAFLAVVLILVLSIASGFRRLWSRRLLLAWIALLPIVLVLMLGGVFGLRPTGTHLWGGLPLTLIMAIVTVAFGLPGAIFLALGRRSQLPAIKALCIGITEITRGLPLLVVLFMAAIMLPLFLPTTFRIDKLVSAQIAMVVYFAAYAAEIVRGGLQAVPRGQYEAAEAAGLKYGQRMRKVILPQGLRIVIPALMNDIIRAFKNTTFVSILGLYDILGATGAATQDPQWVQFAPEAYLFVFALYFVFCFSMSKYSESLSRHLSQGRNY
ncbi:amino acid ABC transporter permease [Paracandidimonas soli]|uniref:amino acid ABC transporter permease n=1 Tax=Paracandidimonas soli TaxID=1917182 RepID=UPI0033405F28